MLEIQNRFKLDNFQPEWIQKRQPDGEESENYVLYLMLLKEVCRGKY